MGVSGLSSPPPEEPAAPLNGQPGVPAAEQPAAPSTEQPQLESASTASGPRPPEDPLDTVATGDGSENGPTASSEESDPQLQTALSISALEETVPQPPQIILTWDSGEVTVLLQTPLSSNSAAASNGSQVDLNGPSKFLQANLAKFENWILEQYSGYDKFITESTPLKVCGNLIIGLQRAIASSEVYRLGSSDLDPPDTSSLTFLPLSSQKPRPDMIKWDIEEIEEFQAENQRTYNEISAQAIEEKMTMISGDLNNIFETLLNTEKLFLSDGGEGGATSILNDQDRKTAESAFRRIGRDWNRRADKYHHLVSLSHFADLYWNDLEFQKQRLQEHANPDSAQTSSKTQSATLPHFRRRSFSI
ncbi:hypothetical protein TWF481_000540 [Arthrobotrys musiformis]|uniref:Uncharacterized protein n=1 Tax=Arthrobotrys musiformis TaxID=47236 RepID=A0AAV9WN36_9PEZI